LALGPDGSVYVSDQLNNRVRRIGPSGIISTYAGNGAPGFAVTGVRAFGGDGGPAVNAMLDWPEALALGSDGSLYIANAVNRRIRRVSPTGVITTIAGNGQGGYTGDGGLATQASLNLSFGTGLALAQDGSLYIADSGNNVVRRVGVDGIISTVVGDGHPGYA